MKNTPLQKPFLSTLRFLMLTGMLLCFFPRATDAQSQDIRFKHLTTNDGLSQNWIHSICQDRHGFMWIGTDDGLNRYDGNTFRVYRSTSLNTYSLSSNSIMSLFEDSRGKLWIGTKGGLNLYDRQNDRFVRNPQWPQIETISIAEDKNNTLWLGTTLNVYHLDVENDSVTIFSANDSLQDKGYLSSGSCGAIFVDTRNNVWIGTNKGLNLYNREKNLFVYYFHEENDPNSLSSNDVRSIVEDKTGRLWIGTQAGLDLFTNARENPQKGIFVHYQNNSKDQKSISQGSVLSLLEDNKHNLWIGTENGGLDLLNLNNYKKSVNSFVHFKNDPNKATSLSNNSVYSLFQGKQGNIWIGTYGNGINIISAVRDKFIHIQSEPNNMNSLINKQVNTILEDKNILWIGTEGGLDQYNKKDDTYKHFVHNPLDTRSIGSNAVWALCKDNHGNLWVGTWGGGLNRFNSTTEAFEHYYNNPQDTNSIGSNNIFSLFEDSRGNLWIGTMGGGLNMYDRNKKIFTRYTISNSGISSNYVQSIQETKNGDLWLANGISIERFDRGTKKFEHFIHADNDSTSLSSNKVISVYEDSKENIWACTDAGLNLYLESINGFKHYQIEDGLPNNSMNSILEDDLGNLWLGTNKGLSKFFDAINMPAKPKFKNYTYEDGLQSNGFGKRSCLRGADGTMYFGGSNGLNIFDPNKVIENTYIPPIVITDFQIFNKPVPIGEKGSLFQKRIGATEELVLSNTQSVFSFEFAALNYISSAKNEYAYKMEGFDKDWNYVGTKHTATYTNLDPGRYVFRVKGSNNDGVWNEEGIALPIVITPPFWKTLWFRLILLAIFLGIVYWIYKWRMQGRELALEKQMEAVLTKERNLLRTLIDNLPDAVFVKDVDCKKIIVNPVELRYLGAQSEAEVIGKTDFDFYPADTATTYIASDKSVMQSGVPIIGREGSFIDKQGNKLHVLSFSIPLHDEHNNCVGIVGVTHDITEIKRVQEVLQHERAILRTLIDNLPDVIYIKDEQCRKVIANLADVHNMGFQSEQEVIGKDDFQFYAKELAEGFYTDDQSVLQTGQPVINREEYIIGEQGQKRWLLTTKLPFRNEKNQIVGLVGIGRDITERKKSEAEREKLITQLQDALADVKLLSGLVPICASCKKIRDDQGFWTQIESYIQDRSDAKFSHSICPDCAAKLYPNYNIKK